MPAITRAIAKASTRAPIIPARQARANGAPIGQVEAAAGRVSGRRVVPDADLSGDPGLSGAAHGLLDRLLDLGGSRRASATPQAARFARGTRTIPRQMCSGIREEISPTILAAATFLIAFALLFLFAVERLRRRASEG